MSAIDWGVTMNSWYTRIMLSTFPCTTCHRPISDSQSYYQPRDPTAIQVALMQRIWGINVAAEFAVCESCVGGLEFGEWLQEIEQRQVVILGVNWRKNGF